MSYDRLKKQVSFLIQKRTAEEMAITRRIRGNLQGCVGGMETFLILQSKDQIQQSTKLGTSTSVTSKNFEAAGHFMTKD